MTNYVNPRQWEPFGWRATLAAVRASQCKLDSEVSYALCFRLVGKAERHALRHINSMCFAGSDREQAKRDLDQLANDTVKPLLLHLSWLFARQDQQRGRVMKARDVHLYIDRRRMAKWRRRDRVAMYDYRWQASKRKPVVMIDYTAGRYDEPSTVYGGIYAKANPHYDETDQGYRDAGSNEAAANDW